MTVGNYNLMFVTAVLAGVGLIGFSWFAQRRAHYLDRTGDDMIASQWWLGISTEMAGALVTTVGLSILFFLIQERETQKIQFQQQVDNLAIQMASSDNSVASEAVRQLDSLGSLQTGLEGRSFADADLTDVSLTNANLRRSIFTNAILRSVQFDNAMLSGAVFTMADITGANFTDATLTNVDLSETEGVVDATWLGADLSGANLSDRRLVDVDFTGTILTDTNFSGSNLCGAIFANSNLEDAILNEGTFLPNCVDQYTPDTDLSEFTSPN